MKQKPDILSSKTAKALSSVFRPPSSALMPSHGKPSQKFWGILTRKERWGLSWRGWLLVTSASVLGLYFAFLNVHPFLAVTHRAKTNILVVEG